jgi:glycosyltransferase involved in cell wall biosynthesis
MRLDQERGPRFEFHVLGATARRWEPARRGAVVHGPYERDRLPEALAAIRPSYALIASIWPETYCHTLTEAWQSGLPVLASDIGTLRERVGRHGGGWLLDQRDPERWYEQMCEIAADPAGWARRRDEVDRIGVRTVAEMAADYHALYRDLLAAAIPTSR